jgi:1,4-alpha-glucan branching enzyme
MNSVFYKSNTVFRLPSYKNAKQVYLSGSFNNWEPRELLMNETPAGWELPLYLADGTHTYRFVVDGKWIPDPANPETFPNEFSDVNSVIRIGKPHLFFLEGYTGAKKVVLSGSFNKWRKDELYMKKTAKGWELPYTLGPGNYQYRFIVDDKWVSQAAGIDRTGNDYFIIQPNYTFRLKGFANAGKVFLAGDFNNWSPNTFLMRREGNEWVFDVHLSPGKHLYKFVVDGKWIVDPGNKLWEQNEHNTGNSVLWIQ